MDKKVLAIYISGGILALLAIIFTVVFAIGMQNKPVNICTTKLTSDMAYSLLKGYCNKKDINQYIQNKEIREAYLELLNNSVDVVLASGIDDETIEWISANDVEVEIKPIAKDALVFVNNVNNPVKELSSDEIKGIYSGKYTNWKEVMGNDESIIAYPPVNSSEEEYMMEKFMGDRAIAKPKYRLEDHSLEGLISAVTEYLDTREKAIFYTTFHNIKNIENNEIQRLTLDEIEVSNENIKSGEYKATMDIYAIIRSDTPENSQTKRFVEYITSKDGQAIIEQCGYVNLIKK